MTLRIHTWRESFIRNVAHLWFLRDVTHSYVAWLIHMWRDSLCGASHWSMTWTPSCHDSYRSLMSFCLSKQSHDFIATHSLVVDWVICDVTISESLICDVTISSCHDHVWLNHATRVNESWPRCEWVMSCAWMRHVTYQWENFPGLHKWKPQRKRNPEIFRNEKYIRCWISVHSGGGTLRLSTRPQDRVQNGEIPNYKSWAKFICQN